MALSAKCLLNTALFIVAVVGLGWLVGEASGSGAGNPWYMALPKSTLTPPGWVFAVVWPVLYALMAIAGAYLYQERNWAAFRLFLTQLLVNYAWSFVFFTFMRVDWGFFWIVLLLVCVLKWVQALYRINRPLAYMQLPYICWLVFAAYLNGYIFMQPTP